jgi:hypothetical protein
MKPVDVKLLYLIRYFNGCDDRCDVTETGGGSFLGDIFT